MLDERPWKGRLQVGTFSLKKTRRTEVHRSFVKAQESSEK